MDNHKIEVGSEWVSSVGDYKVLYVGKTVSVIENIKTGTEMPILNELFGTSYIPKPVERVVWMNVYNGYVLTYPTKEMADSHACSSRLFCQRVVIKDDNDE